jgi:TetR/AcrR family transcriptional repressor of mexJK operon
MATRRGRPTQAEAKALDQTVREAAVATFLEFGYSGASMESIERAVFADVIPWALARYTGDEPVEQLHDEDLETALLAAGRASLARATHPQNVRLKRIAFNEAALFPEFNVSAESMMWAGRQRALTELLRQHQELGNIDVDDVELAAEHFLALVEAVPARMADFGVFRSKKQQERHLQFAVQLFLRGALPR